MKKLRKIDDRIINAGMELHQHGVIDKDVAQQILNQYGAEEV